MRNSGRQHLLAERQTSLRHQQPSSIQLAVDPVLQAGGIVQLYVRDMGNIKERQDGRVDGRLWVELFAVCAWIVG